MERRKFYVIAEREQLFVYKYKDGGFVLESNQGNTSFPFSIGQIASGVKNMIIEVAANNNISIPEKDAAEMDFILVCDTTEAYSHSLKEAFSANAYLSEYMDVSATISQWLAGNNDKLAEKYGVNFDGKNYVNVFGKDEKKSFNLLAKTVDTSELINLMR